MFFMFYTVYYCVLRAIAYCMYCFSDGITALIVLWPIFNYSCFYPVKHFVNLLLERCYIFFKLYLLLSAQQHWSTCINSLPDYVLCFQLRPRLHFVLLPDPLLDSFASSSLPACFCYLEGTTFWVHRAYL